MQCSLGWIETFKDNRRLGFNEILPH